MNWLNDGRPRLQKVSRREEFSPPEVPRCVLYFFEDVFLISTKIVLKSANSASATIKLLTMQQGRLNLFHIYCGEKSISCLPLKSYQRSAQQYNSICLMVYRTRQVKPMKTAKQDILVSAATVRSKRKLRFDGRAWYLSQA